jgi:hypothetical protein
MSEKNKINNREDANQSITFGILQNWLLGLYKNNLAKYDEDGIIRLSPEIARRFSLGIVKEDIFIALQETEYTWATNMNWQYAAVYQGKKDLHLIAESNIIDSIESSPFAMSFEMKSAYDALALTTYGKMQLRTFGTNSFKNSKTQVSRIPFAEFPIYLLEDNESIFEIGLANRLKKNNKGRA